MNDWQAHLIDDFLRDGKRLFLVRRSGVEHFDQIVDFDSDGTPVINRFDPHVTDEHPGFLLPHSALDSLGRLLNPGLLNPGPSQRELDRVEAALAVEQARIDLVIDRTHGGRVR